MKLSIANSETHRRRIRRLTRQVKDLYPLLKRVPNPLPKPGEEPSWFLKTATAKDIEARREAFNKADAKRLDKAAIRYWLEASAEEPRKQRA